jgi:hypothetical protein
MTLSTARAGAPVAAQNGLAGQAQPLVWVCVACMLGLAMLSLANLALLEFGPWRHQAIAIDELYFSACAARGLAMGQIPVAGCHDNKGPVIFFVHQLVQLASTRYDLLAIKGAAFSVVALVAGLAAWLAHRLGGRLQSFAADAAHLALKTETVGVAFVLIGMILLVPRGQRPTSWARLLSGVSLGMAVLTKQTNVLPVLAIFSWFALSLRGASGQGFRTFLSDAVLFGLGVLAPFLVLLALFWGTGREAEFLGNMFIYPSVYGGASGDASALKTLLWTFGDVVSTLAKTPLPVVLFVVSAVVCCPGTVGASDRSGGLGESRLLVLLIALALLSVTMLSPSFYSYHVIPVRTLMFVLGGVLIADVASQLPAWPARATVGVCSGFLAASTLVAVASWNGNGGKGKEPHAIDPGVRVDDGQGSYGYVLGMWPDFYVHNGLIPASNVMFPWALAGAPGNFFYTLPSPSSLRGSLLDWARGRGVQGLMADFHKTPPRYIVVIDKMARSAGSSMIADVPGFDDYLKDHCQHLRHVQAGNQGNASLFGCRTDGKTVKPEP